MNRVASLIAIVAASLALTGAARADSKFFGPGLPSLAGCASMVTYNDSRKWLWVTIYDVTQTIHLDWGWVAPGSSREWKSGNYSCAGIYHVRGEMKSAEGPAPADGPNLVDTRVEVKGGGGNHTVFYMSDVVGVQYGDGSRRSWQTDKSYFWAVGSRATAAQFFDQPIVKLTNATALPIRVRWSSYAPVVCIAPGTEWTGTHDFLIQGTTTLQIAGGDSCDAPAPAFTDYAFSVNWGTNRLAVHSGLSIGRLSWGLNEVVFVNGTASTVQFLVDGVPAAQSPCLGPKGTLQVKNLPQGNHKVTPVMRAKCGDSAGTSYAARDMSLGPIGMTMVSFDYSIGNP